MIDPGGAPVTIIDTDDTPTIRVRWSVEEPGAAVLGGRWLVRAYAESIGPGQEEQVGQTRFVNVANFTPIAGPPAARGYEANVAVPAGTLAAESATSSGVYKHSHSAPSPATLRRNVVLPAPDTPATRTAESLGKTRANVAHPPRESRDGRYSGRLRRVMGSRKGHRDSRRRSREGIMSAT